MYNPLKSALDSKLGRKLRGVSMVNNATNPASAYSRVHRGLAVPRKQNTQPAEMQKRMDKAFKNTKVFGTPFQ